MTELEEGIHRQDPSPSEPRLIGNEPRVPAVLPPELAPFLKDQEFACLTHPTNQGIVLVLKAPELEIHSVQGPVPIGIWHSLYDHPTAPVIRMLLRLYDQPNRSLAFESFVNVEDPQQRADYAALSQQDQFVLLFYDEQLSHRLTKLVDNTRRLEMAEILQSAVALYEATPREIFNFEVAKEWVMGRTHL
jgi:hypothetical protein